MQLEDLIVYQLSMELGDKVWKVVVDWSFFQKDTIGKQLVKAADSVAANISEGFGRYHFKDSKHFLYYSRGSLYETKTWLKKASNRNLISTTEFKDLEKEINVLGVKLNNYIKSIGKTSSTKFSDTD